MSGISGAPGSPFEIISSVLFSSELDEIAVTLMMMPFSLPTVELNWSMR